MKGYHFGKLLEKCGIISEYSHKVIVYQVIKGIIRDKNKADSKSKYILLSASIIRWYNIDIHILKYNPDSLTIKQV